MVYRHLQASKPHPQDTMNAYKYTPPVIDLDKVGNETDLLPLMKQILLMHDSFLLQNFANIDAVRELLGSVAQEDGPACALDASFDGVLEAGNHSLEQWVYVNDQETRPEHAESRDVRRLRAILGRIAVYFGKLCLQALECADQDALVASGNHSAVLSRHHSKFGDQVLDLQFDYSATEWIEFKSVGLLTVVPDATCAKVYRNDSWHGIDVENCILLHTGPVLASASRGMHSTSDLRLSTNSLAYTVQPHLEYRMADGRYFAEHFLEFNLQRFPDIGKQAYPEEMKLVALKRSVSLLKTFFTTMESMINLYKINHPGTDMVDLETILPSISRMMRVKVTSTDFQRLLYIWPQAYDIDINSNCGISIKLQTTLSLTKSRLLEFAERIDQWFQNAKGSGSVPEEIPPLKLGKRKASNGSTSTTYSSSPSKNVARRKFASLKGKPKSMSLTSSLNPTVVMPTNYGDNLTTDDVTMVDPKSSLLDRIRVKERRAAALLSQRELMQDHFIAIKMKHVFDICFTLEPEVPYTEDYLTGLIVDSLTDSHNPIGREECVQVLAKISELLGQDVFQIVQVEGNLKVYKWKPLEKNMLQPRL